MTNANPRTALNTIALKDLADFLQERPESNSQVLEMLKFQLREEVDLFIGGATTMSSSSSSSSHRQAIRDLLSNQMTMFSIR